MHLSIGHKTYFVGLLISILCSLNIHANLIPWRDGHTTLKHREISRLHIMRSASKALHNYKLRNYSIELSQSGIEIKASDKVLFSSLKKKAFFIGSHKSPHIRANRFGAVHLKVKMGKKTCNEQTIKAIVFNKGKLTITGNLYGKDCYIPYRAVFSEGPEGQLKISIKGERDYESVWLGLYGSKDKSTPYYGGGEQFTELNLNGHLIPFLTQEQGHGRARYWTSLPFDLVTGGLSGGDRFTTYIPIALLFSQTPQGHWRSYKISGQDYNLVDLREEDAMAIWSLTDLLNIEINHASTPLEMVTKNSKTLGLPHPTPPWFYEGAVLGGFIEGEKNVYEILRIVEEYKIPTKALWIEDWSGIDKTIDGSKRLKWNWEVDRRLYPNWDKMVADIKSKEIRIGGYLNPLARELKKDDLPYHDLHMMKELDRKKLLMRNEDRSVYADLGLIKAYFVDLLNPKARNELTEILKEYFLPSGIQFWNADFSEALPLETNYVLREEDGLNIRHRYVTEWAKFNRDFINNHMNGDAVAFIRSGHTESLRYNQMYWQGDQLTTFDKDDGLYSTTIAGITSGLSGILINHSDIGGAIKTLNIKRSHELMHRWMEKEAFGALFRSKEGMGTLKLSVFKDPELLPAFAKWANIFHDLFEYRRSLYLEAQNQGLPIIRALFLHYPEDRNTYEIDDQFLFGRDILMAPIHKKESGHRRLYLPKGHWVHFMNAQEYILEEGRYIDIQAPIGCPAVFYRANNRQLEEISLKVRSDYPTTCPKVENDFKTI